MSAQMSPDTQKEIIAQSSALLNKWPTLTVAVGALALLGLNTWLLYQFLGTLNCGA